MKIGLITSVARINAKTIHFTSIPDNGITPKKTQVKLARLSAASNLQDLRSLPGNRFEALKGDRKGQWSIRINDQYRICFKWEREQAVAVEIVDYH